MAVAPIKPTTRTSKRIDSMALTSTRLDPYQAYPVESLPFPIYPTSVALAARAQQPAMPVIGFISGSAPAGRAHLVIAFRQGMGESGYVEGQNVAIECRWAQDQYDQLP